MKDAEYLCDYVHVGGEDSETPYIKAVFRQTVDGMPVTAWHEFCTVTLAEIPFPARMWGSFYSVEEIVPVWRFWPGNDETERSMMCEQILAVNAVNGELIWESRETFAE